jgi:3-polyprenyl-4-hydroxybenzoate decarboxylase
MDDEIKAMFIKLLEGQNSAETKFVKLQEGQNRVETELKKHSIKLESIESKIDVIAEAQTAHKEQNVRAFKNSDSLTEEKVDLLGTSIKSVSKDVN